MTTSHTPTPWIAKFDEVIGANDRSVAVCGVELNENAIDQANAAFIVKAVNAHEALVAALERASNWFERDMTLPRSETASDYSGMGLELRTALRLARGEG